MSDVSEDLEGDVEDFEGDGDLSEWAVLIGIDDESHRKVESSRNSAKTTAKEVSSEPNERSTKSETTRVKSETLQIKDQKRETKEHTHNKSKTQQKVEESSSSDSDAKSKLSSGDNSVTSHKDKISQKCKGTETLRTGKPSSPHLSFAKKRKQSTDRSVSSPKVTKTDSESDILMVIDNNSNGEDSLEKVEDKDAEAATKVTHEEEEEVAKSLSEEDYKNLDNWLVDGMIDAVKEELAPQRGDKYTVRFSPVELADLAENSVQNLIKTQPNLAFYLKRQGKFKKKKGYAEVYLSQLEDVRSFINKLLQIKLVEHYAEIIITFSQVKKEPKFLSFTVWFNKTNKLQKLLQTSEDFSKVKPGATKEKFVIDSVPASATPQILRTIFPYSAYILWSSEMKTQGPGFKGPVNIIYASSKCLEAVLECCTDFSFNGYVLNIQYEEKVRDKKQKQVLDQEGNQKSSAGGRMHSTQDETMHEEATSGNSTQDSSDSSVVVLSSQTANLQKADTDDDISSMTLDVCAGMMESLNKLKQLGTDNPNVLKILEMQSQLAKLQESLSKGSEPNSSKETSSDPWTVTSTDAQDETFKKKDLSEEDKRMKKLTKGEKRKQNEERLAEKQRKEIENLQKMIEEADEADRQREERAKQQIEEEKQKIKEMEEQRKFSWARKMIEDAKLRGDKAREQNSATRQEAQRILKTLEEKHKESGELQKMEEDMKKSDEVSKQGEKKHDMEERVYTKQDDDGRAVSSSGSEKDFQLDTKNIQESGSHSIHNITQPQSTTTGASKSRKVSLATVLARRKEALAQQKAEGKKGETDDVDDKLNTFERESTQFQAVTVANQNEALAVSPDRVLHDGVPVYTEQEYAHMCSKKATSMLPAAYNIQVAYFLNRRCPVSKCPATTYFKTEASFTDHWEIFHKPNVTMRFCSKCTAYFMNATELENHLSNRHLVNDQKTVKKLSDEARVKIVSNPSYRDPGKYLPPAYSF